jgi:uncharacterized membrane protein YeaQ/YmgE (transglycosylase-associated protein family)
MDRRTIWLGLFVGSTVGGYIPTLWGAGLFSFSSIFFSAAGALFGIWIAFRLGS